MSKIALVVGGASGIGAACCFALADVGWKVAVSDVNAVTGSATCAGLPGDGHRHLLVDASSEESLIGLFDCVENEMGPIGALVIAAGTNGYVGGKKPTIRSMPVESWDAVMALNVRGPMICVREMLRRREVAPVEHGRIILIASMAAQTLAINSPASYVASKSALLGLARVAAGEAAQFGVTVNSVAPGAIDTPMLRGVMPKERDAAYFGSTVAGRAGNAEEVAAAVAFLASPASSYINGSCLDVNGGMLMR